MAPISTIIGTLVRRQMDGNSCTFETCSIEHSWYKYRPSLAANVAFTVLFGLTAVVYAAQGFQSKKFIAFSVAMVLGCIAETIGYIGRVLMWQNPWKENPFMVQISCLTFAPAFLAAGIYFTLSRIVLTFGRENSRLPALWYPRIFIPCDVLSLAFQAAGGGLSSAAEDEEGTELGRKIMIVGLVLQVVIMTIFLSLATDFSIRTWRRLRSMGEAALDARHASLRTSFRFRAFLIALIVATLCIFGRCVYRVAELSEGWNGPLMANEPLFIGLEGVVIAVAVVCLCAFNPTYCFKSGYNKEETTHEMKGAVQGRSAEELLAPPRQPNSGAMTPEPVA